MLGNKSGTYRAKLPGLAKAKLELVDNSNVELVNLNAPDKAAFCCVDHFGRYRK
jgi:hypothetical protein